jgi:hypothetical protein
MIREHYKLGLISRCVNYFHMEREKTKLKGLSECRFHSTIFLFRLAGVPLKIKKLPPIYAIYNVTVTICAITTHLAMCVDVYIHRDDLGRAVKAMHMLISLTNVMWIFSYCR